MLFRSSLTLSVTGDIVYAEAFGKPIIILNTLEAVNDLLDKRASYYTNRPELVVVGELMHVNEVKRSRFPECLDADCGTPGNAHAEVRCRVEEAASAS